MGKVRESSNSEYYIPFRIQSTLFSGDPILSYHPLGLDTTEIFPGSPQSILITESEYHELDGRDEIRKIF
jgi:hypothetical protein